MTYGAMTNFTLQQDDIVMDLGSNVGVVAILIALIFHPRVKVFAFEASPLNAMMLQENIRLNNLQGHVFMRNAAISTYTGWLNMQNCIFRDRKSTTSGATCGWG